MGPLVIEPDRGAATQKVYVAGIAGGAFDFSTGVIKNGNLTDNAQVGLLVNGVDPRQAFRPGDTVYIHDVDTPVGTVATFSTHTPGSLYFINLTGGNVGAITNNDELMNATPITVTLGFQVR